MNNPIVAGHQPNFFPWFGYFEKIFKSDVFCFSDDVQYPKQSYVSRVQIPINGTAGYLLLPVEKGSKQRIFEKRYLKDPRYGTKLINSVQLNLGRFPFHSDLVGLMDEFLELFNTCETISELNIAMIKSICNLIGLNPAFVKGTELGLQNYASTQRLIQRCRMLKSEKYLCGKGAGGYQDKELFLQSGVKLIEIEYDIGESLLGDELRYSILYSIAKIGLSSIKTAFADYPRHRVTV